MSVLRAVPSKAPHLNSWDVPEAMPGAQHGASTVERAEFERRCKNVWQEQQHWEHANQIQKREQEDNADESHMEGAISELMMAFPNMDEPVIREVYLSNNYNAMKTAENLIVLGGQSLTQSRKQTEPPQIESADMFPSLLTPDGWQVMPRSWSGPVTDSVAPSWRERVAANASAPAPKPVSTTSNRFGAWGKPLHKKEKTADKIDFEQTYDDFELRKHCGRRHEMRGKKHIGNEFADDATVPEDSD